MSLAECQINPIDVSQIFPFKEVWKFLMKDSADKNWYKNDKEVSPLMQIRFKLLSYLIPKLWKIYSKLKNLWFVKC